MVTNSVVRKVFEKNVKTSRLSIRLTPTEKRSIRKTAKSLHATITQYLLGLHKFAIDESAQKQLKPTVLTGEAGAADVS